MGAETQGPRCPICQKAVKARSENAAFPFCGTRCKQVELGKWLNEDYRMPVQEDDGSPEGGGGEA